MIDVNGRIHSTEKNVNVVAGANEILDDAKGKKQSVVNQETDASLADRYTKAETYNKTELNNMITTPNQQYVSVTANSQTTSVTDVLPATGAANTIYRVGNWDGSQFDASVYSEYAWNGSSYAHLSTKTQVGEVFDISAYHATGGELAKYADLTAALDSNNGGGVPQSLQKGGMSVKFVHTSNNKYIQARLMANEFTTDVTQWQAIDDEPTAGSDNLVKSGGVYLLKEKIVSIEDTQTLSFALVDSNGFINEYIDLKGLLFDKNYNPLQIEVNDIKDILANISADINEIERNNSVSFALVDNNGFVNSYIDLYGVLYPIDEELYDMKSTLDTISKNIAEIEDSELLSFAIIDKNGYVNKYTGIDGRLYQANYSNVVSERNKYADSIVLRSLVVSNLNKIHAFSVYGCFDDKGNMYALYNSSAEHLYEYLEPDSDFALEISKYNICTPYDKEFKRVIGNNDVIYGATYKTPYNSWIIRHNNVNHVNFGSIKDNIGVAFYDIIVSDNLAVGVPTPCTLTYNSTTVDFTITNYLHALYVLGIIDTDSEFEGEAIDNIKPCYYDGKYYKVMCSVIGGSGKIVIMTSTDLVDWTIEGTVGDTSYSCSEMSLIIDSDILYIAYREDESTGYKTGYIIYNLSTDSLINSGWFKFSIAEKPCVFKYQGNIYMLIGVETEIYNNDNERREAIEVYRIENNIPVLYMHTESPYGINYADMIIHTSTQTGNYDTLYMLYSEDKRKLAPYASYSDIAMCELTDLFIN